MIYVRTSAAARYRSHITIVMNLFLVANFWWEEIKSGGDKKKSVKCRRFQKKCLRKRKEFVKPLALLDSMNVTVQFNTRVDSKDF